MQQYLINRSNIESNKVFQRLSDKTQVLTPKFGRFEVVRNRLTHSYEVATSAEMIATSVSTYAFDADYQKSVYNVSLLHDIGHPPFGHEGAKIIEDRFKELGLEEGFSDNNNNFVIIKKNQIQISDYELASLIKYPEKLYDSQEYLKPILRAAIDEDIAYFKQFVDIEQRPTRTVSCEIMDEADRNTYTCADLSDCYCLDISKGDELVELLNSDKYDNIDIIEFLTSVIKAIEEKNKTLIKSLFSKLKIKFNDNYYLAKNLELKPKDQQMFNFREDLFSISVKKYIFSDFVRSARSGEDACLQFYINYVLNHERYPSKSYKKAIENAQTEQEKLVLIRDMIAESTDSYIKNFYTDRH